MQKNKYLLTGGTRQAYNTAYSTDNCTQNIFINSYHLANKLVKFISNNRVYIVAITTVDYSRKYILNI